MSFWDELPPSHPVSSLIPHLSLTLLLSSNIHGAAKRVWGISFFFNAKPMSRFYTNYEALFSVKMRRQRAFVPVDVHVRGYSGSELNRDAPEPSDPIARVFLFMPDFEVVLLKASFGVVIWQTLPQLNLAGVRDGVGLCIPLGQHCCVWRGLLCVTHLHQMLLLSYTLPCSLRLTHLFPFSPLSTPFCLPAA